MEIAGHRVFGRYIHCGLIMLALTAIMTTEAMAGSVVIFEATGDYQGDEPFTETEQSLPVPETVEQSWLPLDSAAEVLPIEYAVDNGYLRMDCTDSNAGRYTKRSYKLDGTWDDMVLIVSGRVYVSPKTLSLTLGDCSPQLSDGRVYCRSSESGESPYIEENWNAGFKEKIDICLFALWKNAPEDYYFTVNTLDKIRQDDADTEYHYATAYVWPGEATCYVVNAKVSTLKLASIIAHEARHVTYYRYWLASEETGDYSELSERAAREYQDEVYARLTKPAA